VENILKSFKANVISHFENFTPCYGVRFLLQVIYIDLLFYRLSDTEEEQPEMYHRDQGSASIYGQIFKYKFCALVFVRIKNKGYKFTPASNVEGLGTFDGALVQYLDDNYGNPTSSCNLRAQQQNIALQWNNCWQKGGT